MSKYHVLCIIQTRGKILIIISFHVHPINNSFSVCLFKEARSQIVPVSSQKLQHFRLNSNLLGFSAILKLLEIVLRQFQDVLGASVRFWTRNWHLKIFMFRGSFCSAFVVKKWRSTKSSLQAPIPLRIIKTHFADNKSDFADDKSE